MAGICFATFRSRRPEPPPAAACNCAALVAAPLAPAIKLTVLLSPTGVCFFFARSCRGDSSCAARLMPAGISFFTYGFQRCPSYPILFTNRLSDRTGLSAARFRKFRKIRPASTGRDGTGNGNAPAPPRPEQKPEFYSTFATVIADTRCINFSVPFFSGCSPKPYTT